MKVYQIGGGSPYNRTRIGKDVGFSFGFNDCNHDEVVSDVLRTFSEDENWWKSYPNCW
ncbi:MAG: hypothetical protein ACQET8_20385 [Bacillota bacterium]